jgi:hypothetical protein
MRPTGGYTRNGRSRARPIFCYADRGAPDVGWGEKQSIDPELVPCSTSS